MHFGCRKPTLPILRSLKVGGFPKFDDIFGDICVKGRRGEAERGSRRNVDTLIGLERILLKELEDFPWVRKLWGSSESITEYRDGIVIGENIRFDGAGTWNVVKEELVD